MVEHHVRDVGVAGSNPATPTTISRATSTHSDSVASALISYCDSYCDRNVSGPLNRRRALELLAASRDGCTMAIMLAHGFTPEMMVERIAAGLGTPSAKGH